MSEIQRFVEAFEDKDFHNAFTERFSELKGGDWEGLADLVQEFGFELSVPELIDELPDGFLRSIHETEMHRFIQALEDPDFEREFVHRFLAVKEGDWHGFAMLVQEMGFDIPATELAAALHDSFYKGSGEHPHLGWDPSVKPQD